MNEKKSAEPIHNSIAQATLVLFLLGMLITLGESFALGFSYLNSLTYVDFVSNSVKSLPFLFISLVILVFFYRFIIWPLKRILSLREICIREPKRTRIARFVYELLDFVALTSIALFLPFQMLAIVGMFEFRSIYFLVLLPFLIFVKTLGVFLEQTNHRISDEDELIVSFIHHSFYTTQGHAWIATSLVALGFLSIGFQDRSKTDAIICFEEKTNCFSGNILATSSSTIAISVDDELKIVPRSSIESLTYTNPISLGWF